MANEVTINIESSLAAMAFVVADQQGIIKGLREEAAAWAKQYSDAKHTCDMQNDEIHELKDKLHESEQDAKNYLDNVDSLCEEKRVLEGQIEISNQRNLHWNQIGDYENPLIDYHLPFTVDDFPLTPCVLLLVEFTKDDIRGICNNRIPAGTQQIISTYPNIVDRNYTINYNDSACKAIAWCLVSDKNF